MKRNCFFMLAAGLALPWAASAQEPVSWGEELIFHTFSIAALDPVTGETGAAVTTRVACVGNGVPWVRAGVGAVATQASTRMEYGVELLDFLAEGVHPQQALDDLTAADSLAARRQVGVIDMNGRTAQHTGDGTTDWAGHRTGQNYVTQGNTLVGPQVVDAVADAFEASEGSGRHLADRLIEALAAGQAMGGDMRKGRLQSAAVIVADPRPGVARRADGIAVNINVCENPAPVAELRRIYGVVSQTLGFRTLEQQSGADVWQLKIMLNALGYFHAGEELQRDRTSFLYTADAVEAVDRFRAEQGISTPSSGSPPGLVDEDTVARLWAALEAQGKAAEVRALIDSSTRIRR